MFAFHFGFIAGTLAEDHDPFDVSIITNQVSWARFIIKCKVVGLIKVENNIQRIDLIVAISKVSRKYKMGESIFYFIKPVINET